MFPRCHFEGLRNKLKEWSSKCLSKPYFSPALKDIHKYVINTPSLNKKELDDVGDCFSSKVLFKYKTIISQIANSSHICINTNNFGLNKMVANYVKRSIFVPITCKEKKYAYYLYQLIKVC